MIQGGLSAFVVMPFDEDLLPVYDELIKPALEEAGYVVSRADTRLDQQNVMRDVVTGIANADLIVADVTGRNANVMYELGVAHGLRRPTITITQSLDDLPFDLRPYRAIRYSNHFQEANQLRVTLTEAGKQLAEKTLKWGSPVTDFVPSDGSETSPTQGQDEATAPDSEHQARAEQGFLDYLTEGSEASSVIANALGIVAAATADVGEEISSVTARLDRLQQSEPGPGAVRQFQRIAILAARSLDSYSQRLGEVLPDLETESRRLVDSGLSYADWLHGAADDGEADDRQLDELAVTMQGLLTGVDGSRDQILDFRESVQSVRGIAQPLNRAVARTTRALDRIVAVQDEISAYCTKTLSLLGRDPVDNAMADDSSDPVLALLESAPLEDESVSSDEDRVAAESRAEYRRGEFDEGEQIKHELE